ncbi:allantoinase, partial [Candidatus Bathyarchaeota archaeon]|nr:allantoinase [Candidatus Bathyarchaeota archaeon]
GRGSIEIGYWADLTVVDLNGEFTIDPSKFKSKAMHSPFKGWRGRGVVKGIFVNGAPVVLDGELSGRSGIGRILKPGV